MFNFICTNCETEIQAEFRYIGEVVECPVCSSYQVVPDPPLAPESQFQGYRILRMLASSLLWNSYEAEGITENAGRLVLLRIPTSFFLNRVHDLDEFAKYVIRMGSLNMPEFPALLDRSLYYGKTYFVFEYFPEAHNLSRFISNSKVTDFRATLSIIRNIAKAMKRVWDKNVQVHQNLIPANIKVAPDLSVKITNMGLSDFLMQDSELLDNGFNIWDYRYMSPEFLSKGIGNDPSCDIYSLGGILFYLLTGHEPYEDYHSDQMLNAPVPDPLKYNPRVPPQIIAILQLLMAKDKHLRLSSWDEVLRRLDEVLGPEPADLRTTELRKIYNLSGKRTGRHAPVGHRTGIAMKRPEIAQKKISKPTKKKKVTETVANLAPVDAYLDSVNRGWSRKDKNNLSRYAGLIAFLALAAIGVIVLAVMKLSDTDKTKTAPGPAPKQQHTAQQQAPAKPEQQPAELPQQQVKRPTKPKASPVRELIEAKLKAADQFHADHPEDLQAAIDAYEDVVKLILQKRQLDMLGTVHAKIEAIERTMSSEADKVLAALKKEIAPLIQEGKLDEAAKILDDYKGQYSRETRLTRAALIRKIRGNAQQAELAEQTVVDGITAVLRQHAYDILRSDTQAAYGKMANVMQTAKTADAKALVGTIEKDLQLAANIPGIVQALHKSKPGEPLASVDVLGAMRAEENRHDPLLRALILTYLGKFPAARQIFTEVPNGLGKPLLSKLPEYEAERVFADICQGLGMEFNHADQQKFQTQLIEKAISTQDAAALFKQLQDYREVYGKTNYYDYVSASYDALLVLAKRSSGNLALKSTFKITATTADERGAQLHQICKNADKNAVIELPPGEYTGKKLELVRTGLKLKGTPESILKMELSINGKDITIDGITIAAKLGVSSGSISPGIKNCRVTSPTYVSGATGTTLTNSLFRGLEITNSAKTEINHCTILTPIEGKNRQAALYLKSNDIQILNSLIYSDRIAVIFQPTSKERTRRFQDSLVYGDEALGAEQAANGPIKEKSIATKESRFRRLCRTRNNVYEKPRFKPDQTLLTGSPGKGAADGNKDCGFRP